MFEIDVKWDPQKARSNFAKHGVSFLEAASVFSDPNARLLHDPEHSVEEDRFVLLGFSIKARMLVVVHAYRSAETEIRIISARKASRQERQQYKELT